MQEKTVLVIDDDPTVLDELRLVFSQEKAQIYTALNGLKGLRQFYACQPDLVILDLMMPKMDGWEVCHQIRQLSNVPIIFLSAFDQTDDIVRGLDSGADDYITKPFKTDILLARARAVLRRRELDSGVEKSAVYTDNYLTIDLDRHEVLVCGESVKLTAKEYQLLACLVQNIGQVLTYQQLLEKVWGWDYQDSNSYIHVYVSHLRHKIEADPKCPKYLLTEHGLGYRFRKKLRMKWI